MTLEWFDSFTGPKSLLRADGRWKCILAGRCPMATAYGETPEEAIQNAIALGKHRKRTLGEIARQDEEIAKYGAPLPKELAEWER